MEPRASVGRWAAVLACALMLSCSEDSDPGGNGASTAVGGSSAGGSGGDAGTGGVGGSQGGGGASAADETIRIHPADPHRLQRGDATWYPVGYYPAIGTLTSDQNDYDTFYRTLIDTMADHGINYFRNVFTMGQQYGESTVPYARTGPGDAADGRPKYDLTSFRQEHFDYWADVIAYAQSKDVVVQVCILDFWHAHAWLTEDNGDLQHEWGLKHDFYQGANNINGIDVATPAEWVDPDHPVFDVQKALIEQVIDRLGAEPNIIWEVANEATVFQGDDGTAWQLELAAHITSYEQSRGLTPHLVMPRDIPNHEQTPGHHLDPPATIHAEMVARFADDQPLIADNDCCVTPPPLDDRRGRAWACLTAGAHLDLFHFPMRELTELQSQDVADGMRQVGYLGALLTQLGVDLLGMQPSDSLVDNGWCYARVGEEYVVYLPSGGDTNVSSLPTTYTATWFNPQDGSTSPAGTGPTFAAPDANDWVLHIR